MQTNNYICILMTSLTLIIILFILAEYVLDWYLDRLDAASWQKPIPTELEGIYDQTKYQEAQAYHKDKKKIGRITSIFSTSLLLAMLFWGGFAYLQTVVATITHNELLQGILYFGILALASDILSLPLSLYNIFVIEEKYGFNKMSVATFIIDKIKGWILGGLIGGAIYAAIYYFYLLAGSYFWIYAWIFITIFSLFMTAFYTSLIVPLFNKLSPLEEGTLKAKIDAFALKAGFPLHRISVIDGSKRSTKANAYFSGIGPRKSIVLYDTLIQDHNEDELVSILAHEVGHYKLKHIKQGIVISILNTGILLYLLSLCVGSPAFSAALGVQTPIFHIGLIAFSLLYSPVSMLTGILSNIISRKNEYEADNFAKTYTGADDMIAALKKLHANTLSNLNPHPWYIFFHYSHPSLLQRVRALMA